MVRQTSHPVVIAFVSMTLCGLVVLVQYAKDY